MAKRYTLMRPPGYFPRPMHMVAFALGVTQQQTLDELISWIESGMGL